MSLDEIITLFESVERGEEGQLLGYHLHAGIKQANEQRWPMGMREADRFSDFLKALRWEVPPAKEGE